MPTPVGLLYESAERPTEQAWTPSLPRWSRLIARVIDPRGRGRLRWWPSSRLPAACVSSSQHERHSQAKPPSAHAYAPTTVRLRAQRTLRSSRCAASQDASHFSPARSHSSTCSSRRWSQQPPRAQLHSLGSQPGTLASSCSPPDRTSTASTARARLLHYAEPAQSPSPQANTPATA